MPQDPGLTERVQKHYSQGAELFRKGNLDAAERELDQVIALAPGIPEPYYLQAKISAAKNRLDRAEELLQTAIRLKPDFVEAHHTLGIVLLEQKRYQLALNSLERATGLRLDYALAHLNMGNAYLGLGRSDPPSKASSVLFGRSRRSLRPPSWQTSSSGRPTTGSRTMRVRRSTWRRRTHSTRRAESFCSP